MLGMDAVCTLDAWRSVTAVHFSGSDGYLVASSWAQQMFFCSVSPGEILSKSRISMCTLNDPAAASQPLIPKAGPYKSKASLAAKRHVLSNLSSLTATRKLVADGRALQGFRVTWFTAWDCKSRVWDWDSPMCNPCRTGEQCVNESRSKLPFTSVSLGGSCCAKIPKIDRGRPKTIGLFRLS